MLYLSPSSPQVYQGNSLNPLTNIAQNAAQFGSTQQPQMQPWPMQMPQQQSGNSLLEGVQRSLNAMIQLIGTLITLVQSVAQMVIGNSATSTGAQATTAGAATQQGATPLIGTGTVPNGLVQPQLDTAGAAQPSTGNYLSTIMDVLGQLGINSPSTPTTLPPFNPNASTSVGSQSSGSTGIGSMLKKYIWKPLTNMGSSLWSGVKSFFKSPLKSIGSFFTGGSTGSIVSKGVSLVKNLIALF